MNHRKQVNVKKVATGECWTAQEALKMHLIDGLGVSDDIIMEQMETSNVYSVETPQEVSIMDKVMGSATANIMLHIKKWMFAANTENLLKK